MRLTILGSGTLLPDPDRHSAAHHVRVSTASVLLDCGSGTLHGLARYGIDWSGLTHIAITHEHADHIGDLSALLFAFRSAPGIPRDDLLTLVGPPGFRSYLERAAEVLGPHMTDPRRPLRIVEMPEGRPFEDPDHGLRFEAHPTPHTDWSVAYRLTAREGVLGYTGDTGPSQPVAEFLTGSGVLVCGCALARPGERPGHLAPEDVAALASVAAPDVLVLTHVYPPQSPEDAARRVRAGYSGHVVVGRDGLRITSIPDGWAVDPALDDV